jgi:ribosomal protein S18 acetylase RimI-like enzyme
VIHIRAIRREDDLNDLIELSRDFFQEYAAHHDDFFKIGQLSDGHIVDYFSRWIDDENGETFIALAENRLVGYITVYVRERAAHWRIGKAGDISGLMVHKDYRRRGIATQLLARARAFFAQRAVRYFTVYTAVENKAAMAFYEGNGLVPLHTNMIGVNDTALDDPQT